MARTRDRRVAGLILLGPVSDIAGERERVGRRVLARRVAAAQRIARRDPEVLVPRAWGFRSAARFVSLFRPGEAEDVFQYYRPDADWRALWRIRGPTAVIPGRRAEELYPPGPLPSPASSPAATLRPPDRPPGYAPARPPVPGSKST